MNAAQSQVQSIEDDVLRILAQKLLRSNQWPLAEKIINMKFESEPSMVELMIFEVFALNRNYRKMLERLPHLAKSSAIPAQVQFELLCLITLF